MSRRQLMRAAAAAGAAAWTAPAILDSVSSAAFATGGSQCVRYYAKLDTSGSCVAHNPSCGYSVPAGTRYVCCSQDVQNEPCPYPAKLPAMTTLAGNTNYYQVTLTEGCYFPVTATWQVVGNYNFNCVKLDGAAANASAPSGSYTGNGYFQAGGRKAWVKKTHNFGGSTGTKSLSYIYTLFCCGS